MGRRGIAALVIAFLGFPSSLTAQTPPAAPSDVTIDAAARAEAIDRALAALNDEYVFADVAAKMVASMRARQKRGDYDAITSGRAFAEALTKHLREVSHDKHLRIELASPEPPRPASQPGGQTMEERQRAMAARQNFGFMKVERLAGNIGYLDLRGFMPAHLSGETAAAAMAFLANSGGIIIDLRQNGGGDPAMVAFMTSYLIGPRPTHLNDFYSRPSNSTRQSWTLPWVPGRRLLGVDVYVLTSPRTFSGAEEFAYNLKQLKRATIVGENSGGGAHLVGGRPITKQFFMAVPSGRPINAVTGGNWEGVGVEPDVNVPAEQALRAAHLLALEKVESGLTADMPGLRDEVAAAMAALRKELGDLATGLKKH